MYELIHSLKFDRKVYELTADQKFEIAAKVESEDLYLLSKIQILLLSTGNSDFRNRRRYKEIKGFLKLFNPDWKIINSLDSGRGKENTARIYANNS